eukprot:Gb_37809 [translate_table: standard]
MATAAPNIYSPFVCAFNASPLIASSPSHATFVVFQNRPLKHFPRLSAFQLPHVSVRTRSGRQARRVVCSVKKLSETEAVSLSDTPVSISKKLPSESGVYAVHDKNGELQFIGISRRVAASVLNHMENVPELCGAVKVMAIDAPARTALTDAWKLWMEEHIEATGNVPPGNEAGNTTWHMKKKPVKPDLRLTPGRRTQLTLPLEQLIGKMVKENEVVVFIKGSRTAPLCGYSHKALTILNGQGVDYETVNVFDEEYNAGLRQALKAYSNWPTFPQVFVHGQFIGGAEIVTEMAENGELLKFLKK